MEILRQICTKIPRLSKSLTQPFWLASYALAFLLYLFIILYIFLVTFCVLLSLSLILFYNYVFSRRR